MILDKWLLDAPRPRGSRAFYQFRIGSPRTEKELFTLSLGLSADDWTRLKAIRKRQTRTNKELSEALAGAHRRGPKGLRAIHHDIRCLFLLADGALAEAPGDTVALAESLARRLSGLGRRWDATAPAARKLTRNVERIFVGAELEQARTRSGCALRIVGAFAQEAGLRLSERQLRRIVAPVAIALRTRT
jgi:hypothetical protein